MPPEDPAASLAPAAHNPETPPQVPEPKTPAGRNPKTAVQGNASPSAQSAQRRVGPQERRRQAAGTRWEGSPEAQGPHSQKTLLCKLGMGQRPDQHCSAPPPGGSPPPRGHLRAAQALSHLKHPREPASRERASPRGPLHSSPTSFSSPCTR